MRAVARARRSLPAADLDTSRLPAPPRVGADAIRGVRAALRRRSPSCLVEAMVLQRWYAAHGDRRDLVVGVTAPADGFRAHAWIEGDQSTQAAGFVELFRRPPG